jgi:hypothetical protein
MPGLVPGIHVFLCYRAKDVDRRAKQGDPFSREFADWPGALRTNAALPLECR